ncbi:OmpA family protein [Pseudomonas japonica]|uniref:OmpA family protein n=1 Tax=Pseudomonas japonica TaxID=256466 RepID=UPI0015E3E0EF|nr:OmpA family protein [Pseudomonas japonica]MBA1243824.1 OmpA family protein [Pseudomonas japonica]
MYAKKTLAFALCLAITGCAHTSQEAPSTADAGWWPFGREEAAKEVAKDNGVEQAVQDRVAKAEAASDAKAASEGHWWWPFGGEAKAQAAAVNPKGAPAAAIAAAAKVDPAVTKAWLDAYEPKLREAIKGSKFQLERHDDMLVVTAPVDGSFNPDRPAMLLPVSLAPITNVAKALEGDSKTSVLILGHADGTGAADANKKVSLERAQSVAAIFRLSGLQRNRLSLRGMGSVVPRAANDSPAGRALNRRVEMLVTPESGMATLMAKYDQPTPVAAAIVALQDVKAVPDAPAAAPAAPAKKATASKKASKPAAVAAKKKPAAKKAAAVKKPAADQQAKN